MPDLLSSLQGKDLGFLRILAEHWKLDFDAPDARVGILRLVPQMLEKENVLEVIEQLPPNARSALTDLYIHDAKIPWISFVRRHGELREMGPGKRDRERPDLNPISATEILWYRGLIFRSAFDTPVGPQEFAYIPDDLIPFIPQPEVNNHISFGKPASPQDIQGIFSANDKILDDACTYLAATRVGFEPNEEVLLLKYPSNAFLKSLLTAASILTSKGQPNADAVREFLESPRQVAHTHLAHVWLNSPINDLAMIPHFIFEGQWKNDPMQTRKAFIQLLSNIPENTWWDIHSFIHAIYQNHPNFQRHSGDFSSWYIKDAQSGEYLTGIEHWFDVEGAYIEYLITGPLFWLGFVEIAKSNDSEKFIAFKISSWFDELLYNKTPYSSTEENDVFTINPDGKVFISTRVPRSIRYQIARCTEWLGMQQGQYVYCFTSRSLQIAKQQGLLVHHILKLLNRHAKTIPPNIIEAFTRWDEHGHEVSLQNVMLLKIKNPEIIQKLRSSSAKRFLVEEISPTIFTIHPANKEKILSELIRLGYLGEIEN